MRPVRRLPTETPLPAGTKSLAFSLEFRARDRTLTGEETDPLVEAVGRRLADGLRRDASRRAELGSAMASRAGSWPVAVVDRLRPVDTDYLSVDDLSPKEFIELLDLAADLKARPGGLRGPARWAVRLR